MHAIQHADTLTMVSHPLCGALAPQSALDRSLQLPGCAADGLVKGGGLVRDGGGLTPVEPDFHHAAFIIMAAFLAIQVAEVHLYPTDPIAETVQGLFHHAFDVSGELFVPCNFIVSAKLDVHLRHRHLSLRKTGISRTSFAGLVTGCGDETP